MLNRVIIKGVPLLYTYKIAEMHKTYSNCSTHPPPEDLVGFISLSTAMTALTLGGNPHFAVLSFFCGLRKSASFSEDVAGMLGMLKSLNDQLLDFILTKQPSIKLAAEDADKIWRKSGKDLKYPSRLFKICCPSCQMVVSSSYSWTQSRACTERSRASTLSLQAYLRWPQRTRSTSSS